MTVLALTDSNLTYVKRTLRSELYEVKSSHLSEALAVAFGFKTNIAFKTFLNNTSKEQFVLKAVSGNAFCMRLLELNGEEFGELRLDKIIRSAELPDPVWREFKSNDVSGKNTWFKKCEKMSIPFITITTRRKYAHLNWDHFSLNPKHDSSLKGSDDGRSLMHKLYDAFCKLPPTSKKAFFDGSVLVGGIDNLTPEEARKLADTYFLHIYSAISGSLP